MSQYRSRLPQLEGRPFLSDGGLETTLIFHEKLDLPGMAAFPLVQEATGRAALENYYRSYLAMARRYGAGFVLEAPTWRANPDWAERIGYDAPALAQANRDAIALMAELRAAFETGATPLPISGCIGPRHDAYRPERLMSEDEAAAYHGAQIETFAATEADFVSAFTMTHAEEAIGIARAAEAAKIPSVISFTVETDGRLPSGETLSQAIQRVDDATDGAPAYYMINCAHPTHFAHVLGGSTPWLDRLRGLRGNSSKLSHAELDEAPELDTGDPEELAQDTLRAARRLNHLAVVAGCCGTDIRHIEAMARICLPRAEAA